MRSAPLSLMGAMIMTTPMAPAVAAMEPDTDTETATVLVTASEAAMATEIAMASSMTLATGTAMETASASAPVVAMATATAMEMAPDMAKITAMVPATEVATVTERVPVATAASTQPAHKEHPMTELPLVTDSFFLGPDIAFNGEVERGFEVWENGGQFYWAEVNDDADRMSVIFGPFSAARKAHHDALLALSRFFTPPYDTAALHGRPE